MAVDVGGVLNNDSLTGHEYINDPKVDCMSSVDTSTLINDGSAKKEMTVIGASTLIKDPIVGGVNGIDVNAGTGTPTRGRSVRRKKTAKRALGPGQKLLPDMFKGLFRPSSKFKEAGDSEDDNSTGSSNVKN